MNLRRSVIPALVLVFSVWAAQAQGIMHTYGSQEGLRSRRVYQVDRDSVGFLWVYTQEGINRFDGSEFRPYQLGVPVSSRDRLQSATRVVHDALGRIWVSLRSGQVFRYNGRQDCFELKADFSGVLPEDGLLNDIMPFSDDRILAATSDGLYKIENGTPVRAGLEGALLQEIKAAADGGLYLVGWNGIYHTDAGGGNPVRITGIPEVRYMHVHDTGRYLFLGTFDEGVRVFDPEKGTCRHLEGIPSVPVRVFRLLPDGSLLAGLDGAGVYRIDTETLAVGVYLQARDNGLSDNTVSDLCLDADGTLWIATSTAGLNRYIPRKPDVQWLREEERNHHVNVIYRDSDGDFWYGTNDGVSLYRRDGSVQHFLQNSVVMAVVQDKTGNVYVGGYGIGLYRISKPLGRTCPVPGAPLQYIYYIYPENDFLWFGGVEGDFCRLDTRDGTWTSYPFSCVADIWPDGEDGLFLAGCTGLGLFEKKTGEVQWLRDFGSFTLTYSVRSLYRSMDGLLWLATDGDGLVRYNPATGAADRFTTENGLLSDSVISVHEDLEGRIWFTTEEGIFLLDPLRRTVIDAGPLLDLEGGIFNPNAAWLHPDGQLSFGTSEGVLTFDPARLDYFKPLDIRLLFTGLRVDYKTILPGEGPLEASLDRTASLQLDSRSNAFSIGFSALNFGSDFRVRYEYCLEGYDTRWMPATVPASADYMQMAPGRYIFRLRAVDKDSGSVFAQRDLPVRILPPWYRSVWAYAAYALLAVLSAAGALLWIRRRRRDEKVREKMRTFVSVAHDLKTPVSLIKGPLDELERMPDLSEDSHEAVKQASRNADRLVEMISSLLDLRDSDEQEKEPLFLQQTSLEPWLQSRLEAFRPAAVQKGLELSLDVSGELAQLPIDRKKMASIVDNLLSNALKYTDSGAVDVQVFPLRRKWSLVVKDTGIGIPADEQSRIFTDSFRASNIGKVSGTGIGLMITRELVRSLGGRIAFTSKEGEGTAFQLTFPLRYPHAVIAGEGESAAETAERPVSPDPAPDRITVLVVDDEPDILSYLTRLLSDEYGVLTASNGGIALEMVRSKAPDVVITDMVMPVLSGEELCRILKSSVETSHIPVILLTAVSARESIVYGLEAGATDYVVKPFDPSVLKARIRNVVDNRERLRRWLLAGGGPETAEQPDWGTRLDREFMEKVLSVLEREIGNPEFAIADLCREVAMSRTAFYNKLKSLTGQGPNDYIRTFRLNRGRELLLQHRFSVQEVADRVGFSDAKYFSICFRKQFGTSPSKV